MAVLLETSRGDLVIDLFTEQCPKTCLNFLKLCKLKYYNNCKFHSVQEAFLAQTGDPTSTGRGGESVYQTLYGHQARFFEDELHPALKHAKVGTVGMAGAGKDMNASQFYITLGSQLDSLDGKHTIFGEVSEGLETLKAIGGAFTDARHRPLQNIRIWHTIALEDPFPDPPGLEPHVPEDSPARAMSQGDEVEAQAVEPRDVEDARSTEARSRAVVLEMIGDLPEAEAKPPSDMLFVCKLNPVTGEEDLEIIFSRFGKITSCDIIRDWKTGDSLCYAFIGFDSDKAAEEAFFKMNNVLIDDRRIKVDFSQSVYHLWKQFREHKTQPPTAPGPASRSTDGAMPRASQHPEQRGPSRELPTGSQPAQFSPHATRHASDDHRHPSGHKSRHAPDSRGSGQHGSRHGDPDRYVSRRSEHEESHRDHRSRSDAGSSARHDRSDRPRPRKASPDGHRVKRSRQ